MHNQWFSSFREHYNGIFFDVDGTLISRKRSYISDSVIEALKKLREKGIKLFIATGRHYHNIFNFI